jgi:hypothetical protein
LVHVPGEPIPVAKLVQEATTGLRQAHDMQVVRADGKADAMLDQHNRIRLNEARSNLVMPAAKGRTLTFHVTDVTRGASVYQAWVVRPAPTSQPTIGGPTPSLQP